ncbi:unnamed protein product [Callosobruchus maculatus]|uniref:Uncharacterized protein n=1 Tax=Callosobruchus maculatus TaxID=64391 RepID=A0A653C7K8_CALMS|nr:unnamed protein product [Callosobruchus maculatus]
MKMDEQLDMNNVSDIGSIRRFYVDKLRQLYQDVEKSRSSGDLTRDNIKRFLKKINSLNDFVLKLTEDVYKTSGGWNPTLFIDDQLKAADVIVTLEIELSKM